jgi:tetratricopeptide (TPR) repeat protein
MSSEPAANVSAGDILNNSGNAAIGNNNTQNITTITLTTGQRVERLFMAPALPPYPIVGRDDLLDNLRASVLAGSSCALSTHGQGGVGKTALAVLLAWDDRVLEHFSGGVLWVALGPDGHPDAALATLITALYGPEVPLATANTAQRLAIVKAGLAMRRFLIVLDDVWQPDHAATLRHLASPGCALLLTSRDQATAEEFSPIPISVAELDEQQSIDLLAAISPATAGYREALKKIAKAVGGLPLALTLVGGYLHDRVMFKPQAEPAFAAIQQVENWLGLSDKQRHLSFEEVMSLSLAALPDETHRAAFLRLAAFAPKPASFSLAAALTVSQPDADREPDLDLIATLVRRNLVERVGDERLTIHPTLAQVAAHRAASLPTARRAHAEYYLGLMNADRGDWQTIEAEWEQIQLAWAWVSSTPEAEALVLPYVWAAGTFMNMRGYWRDYIAWAGHGLSAARATDNQQDEATLLSNLGWVYSALGDKQQALDYYQQALPIMRQVGNRSGEGATLNNIGLVYSDLGDKQQALDYYQQALPISRQVGDRSGEVATLTGIGLVYSALGDQKQALDYYQHALPISQQVGDRAGEATTLNNIGLVYSALGDQQQALDYYQQALPIMRQVGDRADEARTLSNIGRVYSALGDKQQALDYYEQALPISRQVGDRSGEATTLTGIGRVYSALGDKQQALAYYQQALPILRQVGDRSGEATTLSNIGAVYSALGDKQQALAYYQQALPIQRQVGDRSGEAVTLNNTGLVYSALGDKQQALAYYQKALLISRQVGDRAGEGVTLHNIGLVYDALGDKQQALAYLQQALPIHRQVGDRSGEAATLNNIGMVYSALGDKQQALSYYQQALPIQRQVGDRSGEAVTRFNIAMIYRSRGEYAAAVAELEQVVALDEAIQHPDLASHRATLEAVRQMVGTTKGAEGAEEAD